MSRLFLVLLLGITLAPAASAQAAQAAAIRPGTYDLEITFGGGVMEGSLSITQTGDSLTAQLKVGDHDSPVRAGARHGNRLVLESTSSAVPVRYELEFKGEAVSGSFTYNGDAGTVSGRLRTKERG